MSRSIILPLLALGGVILYGTTRAAGPAPEPTAVEAARDGVVVLDEGTPLMRREPTPPPPPAPRLRSEEEPPPPPAPEPAPPDSAAETRTVSSAETVRMTVPMATRFVRYDEDGNEVVAAPDGEN